MSSDMALHPGNVQGYNNEIQIAGSDAAIGHNPWINEAEAINPASKADKAFQEKTASPAGIVHKRPRPFPETNGDGMSAAPAADPAYVPEERQSDGQAKAHEEEKTAIVAIGIAVGLVVLWLSSRLR